jgi:hypothetical protein
LLQTKDGSRGIAGYRYATLALLIPVPPRESSQPKSLGWKEPPRREGSAAGACDKHRNQKSGKHELTMISGRADLKS